MKRKVLLICFILVSLIINAQEKELDIIGYKLDSTLANGSSDYFNDLFDFDLFTSRFKKESSNKKIIKFNDGFLSGFKKGFDFGNELLKEIEKGANYDYLKSYVDEDNRWHIIFRLYSEEGLNYHDFELEKHNNQFKIADAYLYIIGDDLSNIIRSIYRQALLGAVTDISDSEKKGLADVFKLKEIKDLNSKGKYQEAYDIYENLNKESKSSKLYNIIALKSVQHLDEEIYKKFITEYETIFPNDPSLYLISLDSFLLKEQYDKVLENINKLDNALKGDSFLNYMRGNVYYMKKDLEKAEEHFNKIIDDYPGFLDAYDSLLTVYAEAKKNKKAIEVLNIFVAEFEFSKEELITFINENFLELSKTTEFLEWSK